MGFLDLFTKKEEPLPFPTACCYDAYGNLCWILSWAETWRKCVSVVVVPGDGEGHVTYRNQTGMLVYVSLDEPLERYMGPVPDQFALSVDDRGRTKLTAFSPLPKSDLGNESKYISFMIDSLKRDFPDAEIYVGSHGRQLMVTLDKE